MEINFFDSAKELELPVYILQGKYDKHTPTEVAKAYFDSLSAPVKRYKDFPLSAHTPHTSAFEEYRDFIYDEVLRN